MPTSAANAANAPSAPSATPMVNCCSHLHRMLQHGQRLSVPRTMVANLPSESLHRLDVMRIHVEAAVGDQFHAVEVSAEVGCERLDEDVGGLFFEGADCLRDVPRSLILLIRGGGKGGRGCERGGEVGQERGRTKKGTMRRRISCLGIGG